MCHDVHLGSGRCQLAKQPVVLIRLGQDCLVNRHRKGRGDVAAAPWRATCRPNTGSLASVPRVVVDVVPKTEILDPQGQAIARALPRLGLHGVRDVRQGKHFELDVDDGVDNETLHRIAAELLANPVIEDWMVRRL